MTSRLFTSGVIAGLAAGLIAVLLQFILVQPLILEAEQYETGAKIHFAGVVADGGVDQHSHDADTPAAHDHGTTADDAERSLTSRFSLAFFSELVTWAGFGLMLVVGFAIAERFGRKTGVNQGVMWGVAGFISFQFMPALGLSPELPGVPAADLHARQIWWVFTVVATVGALALLAFGNGVAVRLLGVLVLVVPHVVGAPHLQEYLGSAPPGLAAEFVTHSLATSMAAWVTLGLVAGYLWQRESVHAGT